MQAIPLRNRGLDADYHRRALPGNPDTVWAATSLARGHLLPNGRRLLHASPVDHHGQRVAGYTGAVSVAPATVVVSAGCGPGSGVSRSGNPHRTTFPGLHPPNATAQEAEAIPSQCGLMGRP